MPSVPTERGRLTRPRYTGHNPATRRAMADLPQPLGPEMRRCWPGWTTKDKESMMQSPGWGKIEGATMGVFSRRIPGKPLWIVPWTSAREKSSGCVPRGG